MRNETKALQSKLAALQASDERVVAQLGALQSWSDKLDRSIENERESLKKSVDNYCDTMQGELKVLRGELKAVIDKLTGHVVEPVEGEQPGEAEGEHSPGVTHLKRNRA